MFNVVNPSYHNDGMYITLFMLTSKKAVDMLTGVFLFSAVVKPTLRPLWKGPEGRWGRITAPPLVLKVSLISGYPSIVSYMKIMYEQ